MTVVAGLVAPFLLIEFPEKAKALNDREKHIARERILCERQNSAVVHPAIKETLVMLLDWKLLLLYVKRVTIRHSRLLIKPQRLPILHRCFLRLFARFFHAYHSDGWYGVRLRKGTTSLVASVHFRYHL